MPTDTANPFLEIQRNVARVDPGALVTMWVNLPRHQLGFTAALSECFDEIDRDGDGFLDVLEVEAACREPEIKGDHAAAVATARVVMKDLSDCSDDFGFDADRISRADLAGLDIMARAKPKDRLVRKAEIYYEDARERIASTPTVAFGNAPRRSFSALSCSQGLVGDCALLAALIPMALRTPERLMPMMLERGDDWIVRFRDGGDAVAVPPPTDAERALFAYADGLWPVIFELAYGIYRSEDGDWAPSRYGAVLDSVCPGDAIRALTGNDAKVVALDRPLEELRYALTRMEGGQKTAIAATVPELKKDPLEVEYTDDGLVRGHAYSILSYDPDDDMVMLRNPAGGTGGGFSESKVEKGVFWMPLIRFQGNFSRIVVEW